MTTIKGIDNKFLQRQDLLTPYTKEVYIGEKAKVIPIYQKQRSHIVLEGPILAGKSEIGVYNEEQLQEYIHFKHFSALTKRQKDQNNEYVTFLLTLNEHGVFEKYKTEDPKEQPIIKKLLSLTVSEQLNVLKERVEDNIYLKRFYKDPKRWAYESQLSFLFLRSEQQQLINYLRGLIQEDRSLFGDHIFAKLQVKEGNMDEAALQNYENWYFQALKGIYVPELGRHAGGIKIPDLMVYLKVTDPKLLDERKASRDNDYEQGILLSYFENLIQEYEEVMDNYEKGELVDGVKPGELLVIDANINFKEHPEYLENVVTKIFERLALQQRAA